ncbi:MAG: riboflavin synthase [Burkholderiales bacterium]|nr:riboflavin synthase [Burkholderiales bacterium]
MFTGIVQGVGRIRDNEKLGDGLRIIVEPPADFDLASVNIGDSIAINGACMTVVEIDEKRFKVDVSAESLDKTTGLDGWGYVNLEKAIRLGDRLDGHIVSGHIDGVGEIDTYEQKAESWLLVVRCPPKLAKFLAYKGSVAINGVSLTVNAVEDTPAGTRISINLIPHTVESTTFKYSKKRDLVNVEVDTVARYIERMFSLTQIPTHK